MTILHEALVNLFYMLAFTALAEWDMLWWHVVPGTASWLFTG
jgi:hypothetical protein